MEQHYKTIRNSLSAILLGGIVSISVFAESGTIDADVTVQALAPLALIQNSPVSWGTITVGATGGVIEVNSLGQVNTLSGNINPVSGGSIGQFEINGQPGQLVSVSIEGTATLSDGANTMPAEFHSRLSDDPPSGLGTTANYINSLDGAGNSAPFMIWGHLTVGASQAAGLYTGLINVTFDYL